MYYQIIISLFFGKIVYGLYFNVNNVKEVKTENNTLRNNSYFGYSLLLQKGEKPMVIVGVPNFNKEDGGAVFTCDINTHICKRADDIKLDNPSKTNGNFLGLSLDGGENVGEPFVVCAPRDQKTLYDWFYLDGLCEFYKNSSSLNSVELLRVSFGNQQSWLYGFDVVYDKESNSILAGAVGVISSAGCLSRSFLHKSTSEKIPELSELRKNLIYLNNEYLGYKVSYAKTNNNRFIISGAPRGSEIRGKIEFFFENTTHYQTTVGEKIGTYFGASLLAVDVNNDQSDELFVGAATYPGSTYDEGCVYYYNKLTDSNYAMILTGNGKRGARFGTNIVSLGDINLDSYNDVAIAAPFDDDEVGAVYIYMGSSNGISSNYSEILSPSKFSVNPGNVKGFGVGLSKGVDIDNNGFNDVAVGAYLSQHVFIIPTKEVINFKTIIQTNITSINFTSTNVKVEYCTTFKPKYNKSKLKTVNFTLTISSLESVDEIKNIACSVNKEVCHDKTITLLQRSRVLFPLEVKINAKVVDKNIIGEGQHSTSLNIPFLHDCGNDGICSTNITLKVEPTSVYILLGKTKNFKVKVRAENTGQPGYQCNIYVDLPKQVKLNFKCKKNECLFTSVLNTNGIKEKDMDFEIVDDIILIEDSHTITFKLNCSGENEPQQMTATVKLNVDRQSTIYIDGSTEPAEFTYPTKNLTLENYQMNHLYIVKNYGPSPIKTDVHLLVPIIKVGEEYAVEMLDSLDNKNRYCKLVKYTPINEIKHNSSITKIPLKKTIVVDCFGIWKCMEYLCEGERLDIGINRLEYKLMMKVNIKLLEKFLHSHSKEKNIITFVTSAFAFNDTFVSGHIKTEFYFSVPTSLPIWVYIVAVVVGLILLALMVYLLFRVNFFKRNFKDKLAMEKEQLQTQLSEERQTDPPHLVESVDDGRESPQLEPLEIIDKDGQPLKL